MKAALAIFFCVATLALAESSTKPVTVDLSSPKAALKTFIDGVKQGDVNGAKQALSATDAKDKKLVNAGVAFISEVERLVAAAEAKFGEGAATVVRDKLSNAGPASFVPAMEKAIDGAEFDVNSDSVSVPLGDNQPELKLVRESAQWKIDVAGSMTQTDEKRKDQMISQMRGSMKKLKAAREGIEAGRIQNADELVAQMGK